MERERLDLNDIAIFAAVVEAKNLTRAAKALSIPKSTVSRKLAALEHRLGVRLIHRSPQRIDLTEPGRTLHEEVKVALGEIASAADRVGEQRDGLRGRVRVSAPNDLGLAVCAPIFNAFAAKHPDITLEVELTDRKIDLAKEGFDFAIRVGEVTDESLVARQVGVIRGHLVASAAYASTHGTIDTLDDVPKHRFIQFSAIGQFLDTMRFFGPNKPVDVPFGPYARLRLNSLILARDAVLAGLGVARLPTYLSAGDVAAGRLVAMLPGHWSEERTVRVVHAGRRLASKRVQALLDHVTTSLERSLSQC